MKKSFRIRALSILLIVNQFSVAAFAVNTEDETYVGLDDKNPPVCDTFASDLEGGLRVVTQNLPAMGQPEQNRALEITKEIQDLLEADPSSPRLYEFYVELGQHIVKANPASASSDIVAQPIRSGFLARWKKCVGTCLAATVGICAAASTWVQNDWTKAFLLATGGGILYGASTFVGPLFQPPSSWSAFAKLLMRSSIGSALIFPGNMLYYAAVEIGLQRHVVNLIALRSYVVLVNAITANLGNVTYMNQSLDDLFWVGVSGMAFITAYQVWGATHRAQH